MITQARRQRLIDAARQRIRDVGFAFEALYDPHNGAASIRTIEALGFGQVSWIGGGRISPCVSRGAVRWVQTDHLDTVQQLVDLCQQRKQQLWVSTLATESVDLRNWTADIGPTCFVFGNEHAGVSDELAAAADRCFTIPMPGLVQSYNLSVAVAITAWEVRRRLEESSENWWHMDDAAVATLLAKWGVTEG